jgi:hypothetical protein
MASSGSSCPPKASSTCTVSRRVACWCPLVVWDGLRGGLIVWVRLGVSCRPESLLSAGSSLVPGVCPPLPGPTCVAQSQSSRILQPTNAACAVLYTLACPAVGQYMDYDEAVRARDLAILAVHSAERMTTIKPLATYRQVALQAPVALPCATASSTYLQQWQWRAVLCTCQSVALPQGPPCGSFFHVNSVNRSSFPVSACSWWCFCSVSFSCLQRG